MFETYVCRHCLEDYVKKIMDANQGNQSELMLLFFANAATTIQSNPDSLTRYFRQLFAPYGYEGKFDSFMNRSNLAGTPITEGGHRPGSI